jgi:hypothetical protein
MLKQEWIYRGIDETLPERIPLRAGPLEMLYDSGDLRAIRLGNHEIVRRIYVAVRDRSWGTIAARLHSLRMQIEDETFLIEYDVENRRDEIDFSWHGTLRGEANGRITCSMQGMANSSFEKNRIGFCVLLPASVSGQPALVEHVDGTQERRTFPLDICERQPVPPFANLRALTLELEPGRSAALRFSGEAFDMEDQRLWTDASYKVFCTPISLPYPMEIRAGTRVDQQIELELRPPAPASPLAARGLVPEPFELRPPAETEWLPIPEIGLGSASHGQPLSRLELERMRALGLRHLRVDLRLADPAYTIRLEQAAREAAALGIGLEIALLVDAGQADEQLAGLREELRSL